MPTIKQGPPVNCSISIKNDPSQIILFESYPEQIDEGYSAQYQGTSATIRASQTIYTWYRGGDYDDFRLELMFVAGNNTEGQLANLQSLPFNNFQLPEEVSFNRQRKKEEEMEIMERKVRWLQAMCFPKPDNPRSESAIDGLSVGDPPRILITLGRFMVIEGVCGNWNTSWQRPFDPVTAKPMVATIGTTFKRLRNFYPDWYDITGKASMISPNDVLKNAKSKGSVSVITEFGPENNV